MKKIPILCILIVLLISSICIAKSVTYYDGQAIVLENHEDIEILSNEVIIDTINSNIYNTIILKNIGNNKVETKVRIKLEDNILSTKIHDLSIKTNGTNIEYSKDENGIYSFEIEIPKNEGKKIEIQYVTDNNLADAKVIKYNLDNLQLGDKKIGKVKVDIRLNEIDIPLTKAIYPGHYTVDFDTNTVSIEYYNFKVNNLTRNIILEKDTLKDLRRNLSENTDDEKYLLYKIDKWLKEKAKIEYYEDRDKINRESINYDIFKKIFEYIYMRQLVEEGKEEYNVDYDSISIYERKYFFSILSKEFFIKNLSSENDYDYRINDELVDKKICISYQYTDLNNLYVYFNSTGAECGGEFELKKVTEEEIFKTKDVGIEQYGPKLIFPGIGLNGEFLDVSNQDIIDYVNMINADMHIIQKVYDGEVEVEEVIYSNDYEEYKYTIDKAPEVGYYNEKDLEMAKVFYKEFYNETDFYNSTWMINEYGTYDNYLLMYEEDYQKEKYKLVKIDDEICEKAEIPTFILYKAYVKKEENKNIVDYLYSYDSYVMGLSTANQVLQTKRAQELISENREKNNNIKQNIENEIKELGFEEKNYKEIEKENPNLTINNESETNTNDKPVNDINYLELQHLIVISTITLGILVCVCILIIKGIKSMNRRK